MNDFALIGNDIKISIIIPVYNVESYLKECLKSIQYQTFSEFEVIMINDGSSDRSGEICEKFTKADSRFKVYHITNHGVSYARNYGMEKSKGEYVLFVDSDDFLEVDALKKINTILGNKDYDLIMFGIKKHVGENQHSMYADIKTGSYRVKEVISTLIQHEYINAPIKVYKKNLLRKHRIFFNVNLDIGEDLLFNISYIVNCTSFYFIEEDLYHYMIRNCNSLTQRLIENKYDKLVAVNDRMKEILNSYEFGEDIEISLLQIRLKNIYSCFIDLHRKDFLVNDSSKIFYISTICKKEKKIDYFK
ncbi:glycosyltransferase, partial [Turicibacter sanguinis]|nr:glycosyltransferase [Turicibacter sanguinis]